MGRRAARRQHASSRQGDHKRAGKDDMDVIAIAAVVIGVLLVAALLVVLLQG
jgi:hypothetical protein